MPLACLGLAGDQVASVFAAAGEAPPLSVASEEDQYRVVGARQLGQLCEEQRLEHCLRGLAGPHTERHGCLGPRFERDEDVLVLETQLRDQ